MKRISIGFHASPPLATRVSDEQLDALRNALGADGGTWHKVDSDDGEITLRLEHVLWVRVDKDESRVGFGIGS